MEDFKGTMDVINEVQFDESFSFIYSPRPNTTAADMPDDVSREEKKERLSCLVMGQSKRDPGQLQARTICNRVVNFSANNVDLIGQLINIQIIDALPHCLRGTLHN